MTGFGTTGTHTGRYDQLSAVPEISNITLPQHEPHRAVRGRRPVALVSDNRDACSGSAASSKATKAPDPVFPIIEKGL